MEQKELSFQKLDAQAYQKLLPFFTLQCCYCSEHSLQYHIIWSNDNQVQYAIHEKGLLILYYFQNEYSCYFPLCKEEDAYELITLLQSYFHHILKQKLIMINMDEKKYQLFASCGISHHVIKKDAYDDYLYDYPSLSSLKGKKYQKKRNLLNQFLRTYQNRYESRHLTQEDLPMVLHLEDEWIKNQENVVKTILEERSGIVRILNHLNDLPNTIAMGVFLDHQLKAFEIATYDENCKMIVEHIEKADDSIKGLYTYLMNCVLNARFLNAKYVNREEDMGIESLQIAKMQLHPITKVKKYRIEEL